MPEQSMYFIVNPVAVRHKSFKKFQRIELILKEKAIPYQVAFSEYPGHSVLLAQEAVKAGCSTIVAVGGDGTVSEVAQALLYQDIPLGILPFGTGNDLIRVLDIPQEPELALEIILARRIRCLDTALANSRLYLNVAGFGFDVEVLLKTKRYKRFFGGRIAYGLGFIHALLGLRALQAKVTREGQEKELEIFIAAVGNGRFIGGGMEITPLAEPDDGLLDICLIPALSFWELLRILKKFAKGKHVDDPLVEYFRAQEVSFSCKSPAAVQIDGEITETTPVNFKIIPQSLRVIGGPLK